MNRSRLLPVLAAALLLAGPIRAQERTEQNPVAPAVLGAGGLAGGGATLARSANRWPTHPASETRAQPRYGERPPYRFDPQRLMRRPVLDGVLSEGEWDPLYTVDEPIRGTTYVNWDAEYLYVAARTEQPAWVILDVDTRADGWLHGTDNLEIAVSPVTEAAGPTVTGRLLDATRRDAPAWDEHAVDAAHIRAAGKSGVDGQVVELAIRRGMAGLTLRPNSPLSLRVDFLPAGETPAPTAPYEPHILDDVKLVSSRAVAPAGVAPRLRLDDDTLVPGQPLRATLDLSATGRDEGQVRAVSWKGEGAASDWLRSVREPLSGGVFDKRKPLRARYASAVPETVPIGLYQLTCTAELANGQTAAATVSFSVVEPFQVEVVANPSTVQAGAEQRIRVWVNITSAVPVYVRGEVELAVPAGWVLEGKRRKPFDVLREDTMNCAEFFVTMPAGVRAGDYPLAATVSWRRKTWSARGAVHVNAASPHDARAPAGKRK